MNFRKTLIAFFVTAIFMAVPFNSFAAGNGYGTSKCQVVYGGGEVCPEAIEFTIDKKVLSPTKGGSYVDNLGFNDPKFQANTDIAFRITIKNTGKNAISQLVVVDTLPQNVTFVSGAGNYNASNNTVTYTINNLPAGQTNEQTIVGRIAAIDKLPQDQGVICLTNKVNATDNNGNNASDNAAFCVEKPVTTPQVFEKVPVKTIPSTGPEMLPLLGLIPAGITGLFLRKKSTIN